MLTIGDNLSAVLSFEKGRPRDGALGCVVARAAAYQIGYRIGWRQRFTFSENNATDYDNRAADPRVKAGERVLGDRRRVDELLGAPRAPRPTTAPHGVAEESGSWRARPISLKASFFCEVLGDGRTSSTIESLGGFVAPAVTGRRGPSERGHRARELFRKLGEAMDLARAHRRRRRSVPMPSSSCLAHVVGVPRE